MVTTRSIWLSTIEQHTAGAKQSPAMFMHASIATMVSACPSAGFSCWSSSRFIKSFCTSPKRVRCFCLPFSTVHPIINAARSAIGRLHRLSGRTASFCAASSKTRMLPRVAAGLCLEHAAGYELEEMRRRQGSAREATGKQWGKQWASRTLL